MPPVLKPRGESSSVHKPICSSNGVRPRLVYFVAADWFFCSHFMSRALAAQKEGFDVFVLTKSDQLTDTITKNGLQPINIHLSRRSLNPILFLKTCIEAFFCLRELKPDILHNIGIKPIIIGTVASIILDHCRVFNAIIGMGFAFSSRRFEALPSQLIIKAAFWVTFRIRKSTVIFENVDDMQWFVRRRYVLADDAKLIYGAGVDTNRFRPGRFRSVPPLVVLPARLLWDKGIGDFVEASRILSRQNVVARFIVVGDQDKENRGCIDKKTLDSWKREGVVEFWGFHNNMSNLFSVASVCCLPSYREGLPKALIEAMSAGLPCVATDVPGCREVVSHCDNGYLVPAREPSLLASAIKALVEDPLTAKKMGKRGRKRVLREFSDEIVIEKTLLLYRCQAKVPSGNSNSVILP
jgi:glycosyltransferase involved in cell wall biosynthesis